MEKVRLTVSLLKKMECGTERVYDSEATGLYARVGKNGIGFYFRKKHKCRLYEVSLGRFPAMSIDDARQAATQKNAALINHNTLEAFAKHQQPTVQDGVDLLIAGHADPKTSLFILAPYKHLFPKRICDLTQTDIERPFRALKDKPEAANHAQRYLKAAINKICRELRQESPTGKLFAGIKPYPTKPRTRIMREDEAPKMIAALNALCALEKYCEQAEALLLMIYTGQRKSRVLGMAGSQIDAENRIWHVPGNNIKRPVELPLNGYAWEIVERKLAERKSGAFFLKDGEPLKDCRKTFRRACADASIGNDLHIHDLRRSLGSWMLSSGATIAEVSKTLGHSSIRTTEQVYAHLLTGRSREVTTAAIDAMLKGKA